MKKNIQSVKTSKGDKILNKITNLNEQIEEVFAEVQNNQLNKNTIKSIKKNGENSLNILKNQYKLSSKIDTLTEKQEKLEKAVLDLLDITSEISAVQNSMQYKIENIGLTLEEHFSEKISIWQKVKNFFNKKTIQPIINTPVETDAVSVATERLKETCRVYNKKQEYAKI